MVKTTKLQQEIWHLLAWLDFFKKPRTIKIMAVDFTDVNLCLSNSKTNFMHNFSLANLKEVQGVNRLLCLWANKGIKAKTDYSGKSIFEFDDYFTGLNSG